MGRNPLSRVKWSLKDIMGIIQLRQGNKFDANIVVSGNRGDGKSTCIAKLLYLSKRYRPEKHQVYKREDVINLLSREQYGICFDDEAINSGYKRDFQNKGQQELIKIVTAYRDNFNIYASAIPNFFSLDKDLRDLIFIHIHIIERGIGVLHMPIQSKLYAPDRWDARNNAKLEEKWNAKRQNNPNFKFPYHKLSTFKGYVFFGDLTPKQRELYESIKKEKRKDAFTPQVEEKTKEEQFFEKLLQRVMDKRVTQEGLKEICDLEERAYTTVVRKLNYLLKRRKDNDGRTVKDFLYTGEQKKKAEEMIKAKQEIDAIIPDL